MFEHACFISYRHPHTPYIPSVRHFWIQFVEEFQRGLEQYLTVPLRSYRDDALRAQPGVAYPQELSERLCRSVCLVAIIVPDYWESGWCVGEWRAMEAFERARLGKAGLIIPILFRGDRHAVQRRVKPRQYVDFSNVTKPVQLRNIGNLKKIEHIARMIDEHVRRLAALQVDCERFEIETVLDAANAAAAEPDPFAG